MESTGYITRHGDRRARKRLGLPRKAVRRAAERALVAGKRADDLYGLLATYIADVKGRSATAEDVVLFGGNVFVFGESGVLITVFPLPKHLRNYDVC